MRWGGGFRSCTLVAALAVALPATADARPPRSQMPTQDVLLHKAADYGISIVRMPRQPQGSGPNQTASHEAVKQPQKQPQQPQQPQGRLVRLTAKVGSQPNDPLRGWLGVYMEAVEL